MPSLEAVMERFTRAEVYLTFESIWWSHPRPSDHYHSPTAGPRFTTQTKASEAMDMFRSMGFSG